jgi:tetratricopeptide (TPR) repeat protein
MKLIAALPRMGQRTMRFTSILPAFFLSLSVTTATADVSVLPEAVSDAEMARLPDFCAARMKTPWGSPESRAWTARIGENFVDFFHYCAGLNFVNRYWAATNARQRTHYLQRADANFSYIVKALKPDFTMGADLFTNRGEVYKLMGRKADAMKDFRRATSIDPAFVRAYLQLADVLAGNKDRTHALEAVSEGLRHVPKSTALQRRYLELGGKEPFPAPVVDKEAPVPTPNPAPQPAEPAPAPVSAPAPAPAPVDPAPQPAAPNVAPPAIGTPKNPYCRFCPPE